MDSPTTGAGISLGFRSALSVARSRWDLRWRLRATSESHGYQRSTLGSALAVATSVRRARDRNDSARVPRSSDRLQRGFAASNPRFVYRLLSPIENASCPGQGFAGAAGSPAAETWACGFRAASRRAPPPLRTTRRLSYRHRSLFNPGGALRVAGCFMETFTVSLRKLHPGHWRGYLWRRQKHAAIHVLRTPMEFAVGTVRQNPLLRPPFPRQ